MSAEMDSLWSTEGPSFVNSKESSDHLLRGFPGYSVYWEEPQTELSMPDTMLGLFTPAQSATA